MTTAFAGGAWLLGGVTSAGAVAGFVIAFIIFLSAGPGVFMALISVFAVAWVTTRLGHRRKQALGIAQDASGRSAAQVVANLGASALFSAAATATGYRFLVVAAVAALAEAAADTAASECGEALSRGAYLITSLRPVAAGTDGGVSLPGSMAAIVAAAIVAWVAAETQVFAWAAAPVVVGAAVLGTVIDSLLGATLERRRILGNNGVNFVSTVAAGMIALLIGFSR